MEDTKDVEEIKNVEETKTAKTEAAEIPYEILLVRAAKNAYKYAPKAGAESGGSVDAGAGATGAGSGGSGNASAALAELVAAKKRTTTELVRDVTIAALLLLVTIGSVFFFAQPMSMLGGVTERGAHENVFSFAFVSDTSIANCIKLSRSVGSAHADNPVYVVTSIVRLIFNIVVPVITLVMVPINIAYGAWAFYNKKSRKLADLLAENILWGLYANVIFNTACVSSGGVGDAAYSSGNAIGLGYNICLIIGAAACFALNIVCFIIERRYKTKGNTEAFIMWGTLAAGYISIGFIFTTMPFYGLVVSDVSRFIHAAAARFSVDRIITPILNFLATVSYATLFHLIGLRLRPSHTFGFAIGDEKWVDPGDETKAAKEVLHFTANVRLIVFSCIAIVSVFLLRIPSIGLGWEVDLFEPTVAVLIICVAMQVVKSIAVYIQEKNMAKSATPGATVQGAAAE